MKKVFLGGTCNDSSWRTFFESNLKINFFNPVVEDWTEECMAEERLQREDCDYCLYTITPKMAGVFSIAEVIQDSNKRPEKTVFCLIAADGDEVFSDSQWKSLNQVGQMVKRNGGKFFTNLKQALEYLNGGY